MVDLVSGYPQVSGADQVQSRILTLLQKRRGFPPEPVGQAKYTWNDYNAAKL